MMIKLTGGYVSVLHVQTIEPMPDGKGCTIRLIDGILISSEKADVVAARVNEVRAAIATLRENYSAIEDMTDASDLLKDIAAKHSEEEVAENGEEESEN